MFISFEHIGNSEKLYMGNSAMSEIKTQKKWWLMGKTNSKQCFIHARNLKQSHLWIAFKQA